MDDSKEPIIINSGGTRLVQRAPIRVRRSNRFMFPILLALLMVGSLLSVGTYNFWRTGTATDFSAIFGADGLSQSEQQALENTQLSPHEYFALPAAARETVRQNPECALDIMICPDRSQVGRTGPNCSFDDCPESDLENVETPFDDPSYFLVEQ